MLDADDLVLPSEGMTTRAEFVSQLECHYDAFQVIITDETDSVFYWRTQIFNTRIKWKYEGVLHEYPVLANPRTNTDVQNYKQVHVKVVSRRLGARNKMDVIEKYRKDAELLLYGLSKEPLNTRYMFYLAQSYRDCHEYGKSIDWYQKRIDFGGWYEEVYYSYYMIGKMQLFQMRNETLGIRYSLKGFSYHPKRIESMNSLIQYFKQLKDFKSAYIYAKKVKDVPFPKEDGLFLENELYSHLVKYDYAVLSFLTFQKHELTTSQLEDLFQKKPSIFLQNHVQLLKTFPSIALDKSKNLELPDDLIPRNTRPLFPCFEKYRVFNPSVAYNRSNPQDPTLWTIIRCSNFDDNYMTTDQDGMIRTENFLVSLENPTEIYKLVDVSSFYTKYRKDTSARILGYEDMRLFYHNHHWCFLANNDEITNYINSPQVVFGRLASHPNTDTRTWNIEYVVHLKCPFQQKIEKNWVPILSNDPSSPLEIVYSTHPFVVITPDLATGFCFMKSQHQWTPTVPFPSSYAIRNSSPYIAFENGLLGLTHVVYFIEEYNYQRLYYSLFVYITNQDSCPVVKTSNFFHFDHHIVEFVNGIVLSQDGQKVIVSCSYSDKIPKLVEFSKKEVLDMLVFQH
jgi:tetratricopeptide (TPR) repeat protein